MTISVVTSVKTEKAAALRGALVADDDFGALLYGVGDVRLDFLDRLHVDQRPDHRTRLEPVGDLHRPSSLGEALGKGVVDAVLHQNPVGAHAGLAGIAIFRGDRSNCQPLDLLGRSSSIARTPVMTASILLERVVPSFGRYHSAS